MSLAKGTIGVFAALLVAGIAFTAPAGAAPREVTAAAVVPDQSHTRFEFKEDSLLRFHGSFHASVCVCFPTEVPGGPGGGPIRIPQRVGSLMVQEHRLLYTNSRQITDTITFRLHLKPYLVGRIRRVLVRGDMECGHPQECGALPHEPGDTPSNRFRLRLRRGVAKTTTVFLSSQGPVNRRFRTVLKLQFNLVLRVPEHKAWSVPERVGFPVPVRCDSGHHGAALKGEGCVFPTYLPSFHTRKENWQVAINIAAGLTREPNWAYLIRTPRKADKLRHRRVARYWCRKLVFKPQGYQCDEFPFASSTPLDPHLEPNRRNHETHTQVRYVSAHQNEAEGGHLSHFFQENRIFAKEEFKVTG